MKGNKKILVAIVLLLLISATFTTLAIYRSTATATGSIKAAAWAVKLNGTDMDEENATFTFGYSDIQWTTHTGKNNTIAPGDVGVITIPVDASGSEVDVVLEATLGSTTLPNGMTVALDSSSTTEIGYNATEMKGEIKINVTWSGALTDNATKDSTDKAVQGTTLSIPVTLTARQKLGN